jgi:hypothetical protein
MRTPPFDREAARPNAIVQASPWLDCDAGLDHSQSNLDADADQRATSARSCRSAIRRALPQRRSKDDRVNGGIIETDAAASG